MRARGDRARALDGPLQHLLGIGRRGGRGHFAQVVRLAGGRTAGPPASSLRAISLAWAQSREALVDRHRRGQRLVFVAVPSSFAQRLLGAIEQAGLQVVQGERVLGPVAVGAGQVGARQQVLVHAHRALVLTAAAEQVAQREVQLGGVGVVLHRLDEGVDRLVLLFVQQEVEGPRK